MAIGGDPFAPTGARDRPPGLVVEAALDELDQTIAEEAPMGVTRDLRR